MLIRSRVCSSLCLLLVVCSLFAGCAKKQPYLSIVEQTPYLGFPEQPEHLWQIEVSSLRSRGDFDNLRANWEKSSPFGPLLRGLKEQAGFDFISQVDLLCIATKGPSDPRNPLRNKMLIARGRFENMSSVIEKLPAYLGSEYLIAPPPFKQTQVGDYPTYRIPSTQSQYDEKVVYDINIGVPSKTLITLAFSPTNNASVLEVMGGQTIGVQKDRAFLDRLRQVNTGAMAWGLGNFDSTHNDNPLLQLLVGPLAVAKEYYFNLEGSEEVRIEAGLVCGSIDDATKLKDAISARLGQIPPAVAGQPTAVLARIAKNVVVLAETLTTRLNLRLTAPDIREVQPELQNIK